MGRRPIDHRPVRSIYFQGTLYELGPNGKIMKNGIVIADNSLKVLTSQTEYQMIDKSECFFDTQSIRDSRIPEIDEKGYAV